MSALWNATDCIKCDLFPVHCPHMSEDLKSLLSATLRTYAPHQFDELNQNMTNRKCDGDCEACTLPAWMRNH